LTTCTLHLAFCILQSSAPLGIALSAAPGIAGCIAPTTRHRSHSASLLTNPLSRLFFAHGEDCGSQLRSSTRRAVRPSHERVPLAQSPRSQSAHPCGRGQVTAGQSCLQLGVE
jgi:hypothetical protein